MSIAGCLARGGWQGCHEHASVHESVLVGLLLVALVVACIAIAFVIRRQHRRPKRVADQWGALAVMGELCPRGWQAEITVYGGGAPLPADAPSENSLRVELGWKQFDTEFGRVAVARRVWASTIGEALGAMVEDRRTDATLEQIERAGADEGGIQWND